MEPINQRYATVKRQTKETTISVTLDLDGTGAASIDTPVGFFNHMLECFAAYGCIDLTVTASGDTDVDNHHLIEDTGLVLGDALNRALGTRRGIERAGFFIYPMDDALAIAAVDFGGRPYLQYDAEFKRPTIGQMETDMIREFMQALCNKAGANMALQIPKGHNDHHKAEAAFKALGKAIRAACQKDERKQNQIPSTKGVIE